jgi:hypothetical protein
LSDPTFTARDPYTAILGIPISAKDGPWAEGTSGFYLGAGGDDKAIYLVTARHVVLPLDKDDNKPYEHKNDSKAHEVYAIADAQERIESVDCQADPGSITERQDLKKAEKGLEGLKALRHEISTCWREKEKRVFEELVWAHPIVLSTEPGQFTLDLTVIKIRSGQA